MNMILRNFFYAVGIALLLAAREMDPATTQLADFLRFVQSAQFTTLVELGTLVLVAVNWVTTPVFGALAEALVELPARAVQAWQARRS